MPIRKVLKGMPSEPVTAAGLLQNDWTALNECQRMCTNRLGITLQMEQESYLSHHPEVLAVLKLFIAHMIKSKKRQNSVSKEAAQWFTRCPKEIEKEIREFLKIGPEDIYIKNIAQPDEKGPYCHSDDIQLVRDLQSIITGFYPSTPWSTSPDAVPTPDTVSSSFISIVTSDTTLPTPEPVPTPEPTTSELFFSVISNTVDKAIFSHVTDEQLRYDTAYMELVKRVEEAMEVPVLEIKEDINELLYNGYKMFELTIMERERVAAEIAWEKRMRKKLKRILRRHDNFKGYETPSTPKSVISSHESYSRPPPKPCVCHPQYTYNRYSKDRFGIYLPRDDGFSQVNVTATPVISDTDIVSTLKEDTQEGEKSEIAASSRKSLINNETMSEVEPEN